MLPRLTTILHGTLPFCNHFSTRALSSFEAYTDMHPMINIVVFCKVTQTTIKLPIHMWAESDMRLFARHHFFSCNISIIVSVLFLHVKPAQLLHLVLSSLWCRQMHQSVTRSSNYPSLCCVAGRDLPLLMRMTLMVDSASVFLSFLFIAGFHCWQLAHDLRTSNLR